MENNTFYVHQVVGDKEILLLDPMSNRVIGADYAGSSFSDENFIHFPETKIERLLMGWENE